MSVTLEATIQWAMAGRFEEAEKGFTSLVAANPQLRADIFCEWARMEVRRGKSARALELIEKSNELAPDRADFIFEKGVVLFHAGKKGLALIEMDKAVKLEPQNPYRYAGRAYIKDGLGDIHGAIADYEKAIQLDPDDSVSHNNLGMLQEKLGWKEKADRNFNRADKLAKDQELFNFIVDNKESGTEEQSALSDKEPELPEGITSVMKKVFTDHATRTEFFQFLKKKFGIQKR